MLMGTSGPPSRKATRMVSHVVYAFIDCDCYLVLSGVEHQVAQNKITRHLRATFVYTYDRYHIIHMMMTQRICIVATYICANICNGRLTEAFLTVDGRIPIVCEPFEHKGIYAYMYVQ